MVQTSLFAQMYSLHSRNIMSMVASRYEIFREGNICLLQIITKVHGQNIYAREIFISVSNALNTSSFLAMCKLVLWLYTIRTKIGF